MLKQVHLISFFLFFIFSVNAQTAVTTGSLSAETIFVSDTQQPLFVEKVFRKTHRNIEATAAILDVIIKKRPKSVFMLGDIVSLGYKNSKWEKVDIFLDSCRNQGTSVDGLLGNHEVMLRRNKGEKNFNKRFPVSVRTGYVEVTDSLAVILLNSNFRKLSNASINEQQDWYKKTLARLDTSNAIKAIIICCHHAPYSNSKIVGCSEKVQRYFVLDYLKTNKAKLFITGHCHAFEHFKISGKDFLVIGGGGGIHHPLDTSENRIPAVAATYNPQFHYLSVKRNTNKLIITSYYLTDDFTRFETGYNFDIGL